MSLWGGEKVGVLTKNKKKGGVSPLFLSARHPIGHGAFTEAQYFPWGAIEQDFDALEGVEFTEVGFCGRLGFVDAQDLGVAEFDSPDGHGGLSPFVLVGVLGVLSCAWVVPCRRPRFYWVFLGSGVRMFLVGERNLLVLTKSKGKG